MRLFLVPISTKRALVYSRPLSKDVARELSLVDRITSKTAETWAKWEETDKGWKKRLVSWGNQVQQRIPYEEWGLKSIPSLRTQRRLNKSHPAGNAGNDGGDGNGSGNEDQKVDVLYPANAIHASRVYPVLHQLATERQAWHRNKMWWSCVLAPITAPIGLVPLVPNIPFFYLIYRGWSHWRAFNGSKHLEYLVGKSLLNPKSLPELESLYADRVSDALKDTSPKEQSSKMAEDVAKSGEDRMLLQFSDAKKLAAILDTPELVLEAERAILQVEEQQKRRSGKDGEAAQEAGPTRDEGKKAS